MTENIEKVRNLTTDNKLLNRKVDELQREIGVLREYSTNAVNKDIQYEFDIQITSLKTEIELKENKIKILEEQVEKEKKIANENRIKFKVNN